MSTSAVTVASAERPRRLDLVRGGLNADSRPRAVLALVCALHSIAPLILVGAHFSYEWDETVYISQVSMHAPAGLFTAPRARGLTILLAPLTELTASTAALRFYLAALSGIGLYLAFRPWLGLRAGYVVPLAAALFATVWTSIYYGFEAQPNFYIAVGAVAAVGRFLRARQEPERWCHVAWLGGWLAFTALMRPSDSLYLVAPLGVAALTMRHMSMARRGAILAVMFAGIAVGWSEWIVEAYVSYGGFAHRLQAASAENDSGLHMALGLEARALTGPTLCRPCTTPIVWPAVAWWFAVPPAVALGIAAAACRRAVAFALLPALCGLALLAEYVFMIDYAAPRFLLPTYALLSLAAAEGLLWGFGALTRQWSRTAWIAILCALLAVQLASQVAIMKVDIIPVQMTSRMRYLVTARAIQLHGVRQPCVVVGHTAAPIAFDAGCTDVPTITHPQPVRAKAKDVDVVVITTRHATGRFFSRWNVYPAFAPRKGYQLYLYVHLRP